MKVHHRLFIADQLRNLQLPTFLNQVNRQERERRHNRDRNWDDSGQIRHRLFK